MLMLIMVLVLIFLLGWPFEWPAIVLVFLPIFYPVVAALKIDMVWFGALTAVTLADRFLVAASGYVCLLLETGGQGLESRYHLQWHGPIHDPAGHLHRDPSLLSANRTLVPAEAAGSRARRENS